MQFETLITSTEKINHQNDIGNHHWWVHERTKLLENLGQNLNSRFGEIVLRSLANTCNYSRKEIARCSSDHFWERPNSPHLDRGQKCASH